MTITSSSCERDHYELLQVPRTATPAEIKASYHRLLLSHHPDKSSSSRTDSSQTQIDIDSLKKAFTTLFSHESRSRYDMELSSRSVPSSWSRPAQIVSLEDFQELGEVWTHHCRCGGRYTIGEADMENGVHLVPCLSCSEVIWVGYQVCPPDETPESPSVSVLAEPERVAGSVSYKCLDRPFCLKLVIQL